MNYWRKNFLSFKITMWLNTYLPQRILMVEDIRQTLFPPDMYVLAEQDPALKTAVSF